MCTFIRRHQSVWEFQSQEANVESDSTCHCSEAFYMFVCPDIILEATEETHKHVVILIIVPFKLSSFDFTEYRHVAI